MKTMLLMSLSLCLMSCSLFDRKSEGPRKSVKQEDMTAVRSGRPEAGPRKRILVLPFLDANPARSPEFREKARQAFLLDLNRRGDILAVDSEELKNSPEKFLDKGEYRMKDLAQESRDLGVVALLEGKILDIKVRRSGDSVGIVRKMTTTFEAVARVRLASSHGGREIFNVVKTVTVEQDDVRVAERVDSDRFISDNPELLMVIVKDAFLDFAPQISSALEKISWEGRIAALSGDRVYLNVGRISGLQVGDLLRVSEEGEDVFDPESGTHLGRVAGRMKGTLEVVGYFGSDGAIAVIHSGSGFKENDKVEFYQ